MDIEKLMNDEAFAAQIENAKDLAEVAALLQAHGVEVTEKDLKAALTAEEGELDEASLEDVAGGYIKFSPNNPVIKWISEKLFGKKK